MNRGVQKGLDAERRFFEAHQTRTDETSEWFRKVRPVSPYMDLKGIDAIVHIRTKDEHSPTKAPLQIKSSEWGREKYQKTMPVLLAENVRPW